MKNKNKFTIKSQMRTKKQKKFRKIVEDNGNLLGCIVGSIGFLFFIYLVWSFYGDSILTAGFWLIGLIISWDGWNSYFNSRKVHYKEIR